MKKNFVKKTLASTLALAMVVTAVPASTASAAKAKAPKLNKTSKTLYINDNEIGSSYDFNISNKVAKSTYKWTTSNKAVATVKSNGLTTAGTKTGKATISCKITLPTKKTKTLKATVTVKENATKVVIKNAPEKEIGIGVDAYDFDSTQTTASGAKATDYRTWEIDEASNTAGATIDAKNGKVTTTKAGTFKVRVRSYQNKTKLAANDTVDSEWLEVKVVSSIVGVKQSALTKVVVSFDDNMKDKVKATDFAIKNKATTVVAAVKGISFSDNGKDVTIETFASYLDSAEYVLTYGGTEYTFSTSIGDVASVEVTDLTVFPGEAEEIKYVLKNANGVDITAAKDSTVSIEEVENKNGWLDGKNLTIFEKDKTAKIKITYHTYKYDGNTEVGAISQEYVFTCVDKTAATLGNYKQYTITGDSTINWKKVTKTTNSLSKGQTKNLFVEAKNSDDKDVDMTDFTFESGNKDILLVDTANGYAQLTAVAEGSTVVVVKNDKGTVIWTLPVVILSESKPFTITADKTSVKVSTQSGIEDETIAVTIKDQHGNELDATTDKYDVVPVKTGVTGGVSYTETKGKILINGAGATKGSYDFYIVLKENTNKKIRFTVNVDDNVVGTTYGVILSDNTVDTAVTKNEEKSVTIKVVKYNKAGVIVGYDDTAKIKVTGPDEDYKDGVTVTASSTSIKYIENVAHSGSTEAVKLASGNYKVEVTTADGKTTTKAFKVLDTQAAPTYTIEKDSSDKAGVAAINECIKVKSADGVDLTVDSMLDVDATTNYNQHHIKSITVYETIDGVEVKHVIKINKTLVY